MVPVSALAASVDRVLSGAFDTRVIVWDRERAVALRALRLHEGNVTATAFLPDGGHVEFLRGIRNPVGMKAGPSLPVDEFLRLMDTIVNGYDQRSKEHLQQLKVKEYILLAIALFILFVLRENTAQISHASFGAAIGLFARASLQFLLAHGHAGPVPSDSVCTIRTMSRSGDRSTVDRPTTEMPASARVNPPG